MFGAETIFHTIVEQSPALQRFVAANPLVDAPQKVASRWRSCNDIFIVPTPVNNFVVKRLNQEADWREEMDHFYDLTRTYPELTPTIHLIDGPVCVMEHVQGDDILTVLKKPVDVAASLMASASQALRQVYDPKRGSLGKACAESQLKYTERYAKNDPDKRTHVLLTALGKWDSVLQDYPAQLIHNDLNTANALVTPKGQLRAIDPRADVSGIRDVAKDLGRLLAGAAAAMQNDEYTPKDARKVFEGTILPWQDIDPHLAQRVAFYIGQSFLSFSRWNTERLAKEGLYQVGINILYAGAKAYQDFDALTDRVIFAVTNLAYPKYGQQ